jgi:hypothetical protein
MEPTIVPIVLAGAHRNLVIDREGVTPGWDDASAELFDPAIKTVTPTAA